MTAERSGTGEALLMINPHIPWVGPYRMFEARTVSPGRHCHGATPIGFPWQSFAYTPEVGWTHTVNPCRSCGSTSWRRTGTGTGSARSSSPSGPGSTGWRCARAIP